MKKNNLLKEIFRLTARIKKHVKIMEVCGTHTQAISRFGIRKILPKNIELVTGPGCPVCVTAQEDIDAAVNLARFGVPIATYGDVLRVPGYFGSLEKARAQGAKVFEVYSVEDALKIKKQIPELVFFGIGFETTAPMTAVAIKKGLTVYSAHKLFFPAMKALLKIPNLKIDGFLCPGHVSVIIGSEIYRNLKVRQVIAGFEAEDVLESIYLLLDQIAKSEYRVDNEYSRAVSKKGNIAAQKIISEVFDAKAGNWRGLGKIPNSGLEIKKKYQKLDAKVKYKNILDKVDFLKSNVEKTCQCADILLGIQKPKNCPLFGKACNPENPQGPCMVSAEGACNVEYKF
jgi:hydrogenase expression/formation protein HypD